MFCALFAIISRARLRCSEAQQQRGQMQAVSALRRSLRMSETQNFADLENALNCSFTLPSPLPAT